MPRYTSAEQNSRPCDSTSPGLDSRNGCHLRAALRSAIGVYRQAHVYGLGISRLGRKASASRVLGTCPPTEGRRLKATLSSGTLHVSVFSAWVARAHQRVVCASARKTSVSVTFLPASTTPLLGGGGGGPLRAPRPKKGRTGAARGRKVSRARGAVEPWTLKFCERPWQTLAHVHQISTLNTPRKVQSMMSPLRMAAIYYVLTREYVLYLGTGKVWRPRLSLDRGAVRHVSGRGPVSGKWAPVPEFQKKGRPEQSPISLEGPSRVHRACIRESPTNWAEGSSVGVRVRGFVAALPEVPGLRDTSQATRTPWGSSLELE